MEGNCILDILHSRQELDQSLKAEAEAPGVGGALPPHVQVPVQAVLPLAQPLLQDLSAGLPQTAPGELPDPGHQEVHPTDQVGLTLH